MDELLKISVCDGDTSKQLRFACDKVSVNIPALEAFGIQSDQYGSLFILVIMSNLPSDVPLQIARKTERNVGVIKGLLKNTLTLQSPKNSVLMRLKNSSATLYQLKTTWCL